MTSLIRPNQAAPLHARHGSAGRRLTSEPGVRFGIANGAVATDFLAAFVMTSAVVAALSHRLWFVVRENARG